MIVAAADATPISPSRQSIHIDADSTRFLVSVKNKAMLTSRKVSSAVDYPAKINDGLISGAMTLHMTDTFFAPQTLAHSSNSGVTWSRAALVILVP